MMRVMTVQDRVTRVTIGFEAHRATGTVGWNGITPLTTGPEVGAVGVVGHHLEVVDVLVVRVLIAVVVDGELVHAAHEQIAHHRHEIRHRFESSKSLIIDLHRHERDRNVGFGQRRRGQCTKVGREGDGVQGRIGRGVRSPVAGHGVVNHTDVEHRARPAARYLFVGSRAHLDALAHSGRRAQNAHVSTATAGDDDGTKRSVGRGVEDTITSEDLPLAGVARVGADLQVQRRPAAGVDHAENMHIIERHLHGGHILSINDKDIDILSLHIGRDGTTMVLGHLRGVVGPGGISTGSGHLRHQDGVGVTRAVDCSHIGGDGATGRVDE